MIPFRWSPQPTYRIIISLLAYAYLSVCLNAQEAQDAKSSERKNGTIENLAKIVLGENAGNRLFYFPTRDQPYTPLKYGYSYEDVFFKSADGTELHGWFMPSVKGVAKAKGTVVFSHGNTGSLGHHLGFVDWLMRKNYNVLMYDYRGFGKSKGKVSRKGLIEDVQAAFSYIKTRNDVDLSKLISYSHSLGGAKAIVALALEPVENLRAVIVHGSFASYQDMARQKAGQLGVNLTTDELSAIDYVDKISPVPLLFVHGEDDRVVPLSQALKLYERAKQPKVIFRVPDGSHSDSLRRNNMEYRKKLLTWLDQVID